MYCPRCGQQQVSEVTRFCSKCGFPLDGVTLILASGGVVSTSHSPSGYKQLSARRKGVRQGALIMLSTLLLVPLVSIFSVAFLETPALIALTAILCFIGGFLRILYALLMEDANPPLQFEQPAYAPRSAQIDRPPQYVSLPPPPAGTAPWRSRPNTAEIYQPPSVTENTTRLLDKDENKNR